MKSILIPLLNLLIISGAALMLPESLLSMEGDLAMDLREYLDSEGKPSDSNSERWKRLTAGGITLTPFLEYELERSNEMPALYHIANIAAHISDPNEGRRIVIEVMRKVDDLNIPTRYLFVDPVCKVATIEDTDLVVSFKDPDRKYNNALVSATLARISSAENGLPMQASTPPGALPPSPEKAPDAQPAPAISADKSSSPMRWPVVAVVAAVLGLLWLLLKKWK